MKYISFINQYGKNVVTVNMENVLAIHQKFDWAKGGEEVKEIIEFLLGKDTYIQITRIQKLDENEEEAESILLEKIHHALETAEHLEEIYIIE